MTSDLTAPADDLMAECVTQMHAIRREAQQLRCQAARWQPRDVPSKHEWDECPITNRRRKT